jgi:hypothetical protein
MILAEEIKRVTSLREVIAGSVELRKRGREWVGLCPFHTEKTPSFHVNEKKQVWHCWGCGAGGDVLSFVQRIEGLTFSAAVRRLASKAGLSDALAAHVKPAPQFELAGSELKSFDHWLWLKRNRLLSRLGAIEQREQAALHFAECCWSAPGEIPGPPGDHRAHVQEWAEQEHRRLVIPPEQLAAVHKTLTFAHIARAAIEELLQRIENDPAGFVQPFLREFYGDHELHEVLS